MPVAAALFVMSANAARTQPKGGRRAALKEM